MAKTVKHLVILRSVVTATEAEFLVGISGAVKTKSGKLRLLWCTSVKTGGPYLELTITKPGASWELPVKIPHGYVLVIFGKEDAARRAGFVVTDD